MKIDGNPKEKLAHENYCNGNIDEYRRLQNEFLEEFHREEKDTCPCREACRYHGNCRDCVAIHRGHQAHVPNCMRPLLNDKIRGLSALTEGSAFDEEDK